MKNHTPVTQTQRILMLGSLCSMPQAACRKLRCLSLGQRKAVLVTQSQLAPSAKKQLIKQARRALAPAGLHVERIVSIPELHNAIGTSCPVVVLHGKSHVGLLGEIDLYDQALVLKEVALRSVLIAVGAGVVAIGKDTSAADKRIKLPHKDGGTYTIPPMKGLKLTEYLCTLSRSNKTHVINRANSKTLKVGKFHYMEDQADRAGV